MVGEDLADGRRDLRTAVHLAAVDANQAAVFGRARLVTKLRLKPPSKGCGGDEAKTCFIRNDIGFRRCLDPRAFRSFQRSSSER
jgi:hypothetical protein